MSTVVSAAEAERAIQDAAPPQRAAGYWAGVGKRLRRDPVTIACMALLLLMLLAILFAPWLAPHDPYQGSMLRRLKPVGYPGYPLGTDELGRDMLTRLLYGGRLSWFLGITPVVVASPAAG
jgi:peptide/nickel transport system permease protein